MNPETFNPGQPRIVLSAGEPAGIGPDIIVQALQSEFDAIITVVGDSAVIAERAEKIGIRANVKQISAANTAVAHQPGNIQILESLCPLPVIPGEIDAGNSGQVIDCINQAADLCINGTCDAMVTAPVHKAAINDGGIEFSGHTEWIANRCGRGTPVMMLASPTLRVCLATTHLPLSRVPGAISSQGLRTVIEIMHRDLSELYQFHPPRIGVCGLNPHAGEDGYLGMEEMQIISPLLESMRAEGIHLVGPLPADTAFTESQLRELDAVLAMYHDQGLPVVKHQGFGEVVNVTLGLPITRTSVDHGTALSLAGTGRASAESMVNSIALAIQFASNKLQT